MTEDSVAVCDMYPLSHEAELNVRFDHPDRVKAGHLEYRIDARRERYDGDRLVSSSQFASRRVYRLTESEQELIRTIYPGMHADAPRWIQIRQDLAEAGHDRADLSEMTAPEVLRALERLLRPASWLKEHTEGVLTPDQLRKAAGRGKLRAIKRDALLYYWVPSVCDRHPEVAHLLRATAKSGA